MGDTTVELDYLGRTDVEPSISDAMSLAAHRFCTETGTALSFDVDFSELATVGVTIPFVDALAYDHQLSGRPAPVFRLLERSRGASDATCVSVFDLSPSARRTPDAAWSGAVLAILDRRRPNGSRNTFEEAEEDMVASIRSAMPGDDVRRIVEFLDDQYRWRCGPTLLPDDMDGLRAQVLVDWIVVSARRHLRHVVSALRPERIRPVLLPDTRDPWSPHWRKRAL